ncbi:peptide deformylase [Tolypothrix sp. PCC 7910]|uniref:peptide deformylase n=1 Tax=Tolypothrix sp. PCC 7910 TaxID=2099387 RepID=UPI00142770EB|nr:peptide deformylase [Tolypothrix sp. PCC 7910]QIR39835.1 peptide deformylase [Tolypothrix sp. PCC 7910]
MAELIPIIQLGNPILRQKASLIDNVQSEVVKNLIEDLLVTVARSNGVGIAAPQIAESYRLFIVASRPNPRYPNAPEMKPTAMINPKIIGHSTEMIKGWEGCLSVPGVRGLVPRYQKIQVEYTDRNGELQQQELTDFVARIFQHEYDHLEGIVFVDRLESTQDMMTEQEYQQRIVNNL